MHANHMVHVSNTRGIVGESTEQCFSSDLVTETPHMGARGHKFAVKVNEQEFILALLSVFDEN